MGWGQTSFDAAPHRRHEVFERTSPGSLRRVCQHLRRKTRLEHRAVKTGVIDSKATVGSTANAELVGRIGCALGGGGSCRGQSIKPFLHNCGQQVFDIRKVQVDGRRRHTHMPGNTAQAEGTVLRLDDVHGRGEQLCSQPLAFPASIANSQAISAAARGAAERLTSVLPKINTTAPTITQRRSA